MFRKRGDDISNHRRLLSRRAARPGRRPFDCVLHVVHLPVQDLEFLADVIQKRAGVAVGDLINVVVPFRVRYSLSVESLGRHTAHPWPRRFLRSTLASSQVLFVVDRRDAVLA